MNHVTAFLKWGGFSYVLIRKCLEDMKKPVVGTFLKSCFAWIYRKVCKDKNYTVRNGLPLRHARERRSEGTVSFFLFIFPNCFNSLQWVCITFIIKKIIWKIFNVLNQFLMIWENIYTIILNRKINIHCLRLNNFLLWVHYNLFNHPLNLIRV